MGRPTGNSTEQVFSEQRDRRPMLILQMHQSIIPQPSRSAGTREGRKAHGHVEEEIKKCKGDCDDHRIEHPV